jgi:hypothetical protein
MASAARLLAKRLVDAGFGPGDLRQAVLDMSVSLADAANDEGLEAQCAFLLQAYGPDELFARFADNCQRVAAG